MGFLSSVSFFFIYNGDISGSLIPAGGLRQRDPISPYLFVICVDAFSVLISKTAQENIIHGARVCNGAPRISHLFLLMIVYYLLRRICKSALRLLI